MMTRQCRGTEEAEDEEGRRKEQDALILYMTGFDRVAWRKNSQFRELENYE